MDQLQCIFFSEFDVELGPILVHQIPTEFISKEQFDSVKKYFITKPELCNSLITINYLGYRIVGYPVDIPGSHYARNHLLFNLAFVFKPGTETQVYESLVSKMASYLRSLEIDSGYISKKLQPPLAEVINKIHSDLTNGVTTVIPINDATTIRLHVRGEIPALLPIPPHVVPVPLRSPPAKHDITMTQVWRYVNGVHHVKRISVDSHVNEKLVQRCLQQLAVSGIVDFVDVFQYSNVYVVTPGIARFTADSDLHRDANAFVVEPGATPPEFEVLFTLYCDLTPRTPYTSVSHFIRRHDLKRYNIIPRNFFQFGQMRGLIRRVNKYPIRAVRDQEDSSANTSKEDLPPVNQKDGDAVKEDPVLKAERERKKKVFDLCDGSMSVDQICCQLDMSAKDVEDIIENDEYTVVYRK